MNEQPRISLRNVCRSYDFGRIKVLKDVNFDVCEGERIGIIGENGAGKTTLLRIIAGVLRASSGETNIQGDVHAALTLGLGLREESSGRENLQIEAEIHGYESEEIPSLVKRMADFADIGEFIDHPVQTYSSGMKSRLTFASLVISQPEILLIDEILSTGDQSFQPKAKKAIDDLCRRGKIVIIVSHSMSAIRDMCTRSLWIKDGRIAMDGDVFEVTKAYEERLLHKKEDQVTRELKKAVSGHGREELLESISLLSAGKDVTNEVLSRRQPLCLKICFPKHAAYVGKSISVAIEQLDGGQVSMWDANLSAVMSKQIKNDPVLYLDLGDIPLETGLHVFRVDVKSTEQDVEDSISLPVTVDTGKIYVGGSPMISSDYETEWTLV